MSGATRSIGQDAALGDHVGQARAVDPLEHEEGRRARLAVEVEHLHDARVAQRHRQLGAATKDVPRRRRGPLLDRESAGEALVAGFVHRAWSVGDRADQPVLAAEDVPRQLSDLSHGGILSAGGGVVDEVAGAGAHGTLDEVAGAHGTLAEVDGAHGATMAHAPALTDLVVAAAHRRARCRRGTRRPRVQALA